MADSKLAEEKNIKCSSCREMFAPDEVTLKQKADTLKGTYDQFQCKGCGALHSRICRRWKVCPDTVEGFREVSPDSRADFMKKHQGLFGKDLDKAMVETSTASRINRSSAAFRSQGKFEDIEGPEGIKVRLKDQPEKLANILENGRRFTCPVSKFEQVWVPIHSLDLADEEIRSEEKKRKMEAASTIKREKRPKTTKKASGEGEKGETAAGEKPDASEEGETEAKMVAICTGHVKRLQTSIPNLEDVLLSLSTAVTNISAPDLEGNIGPTQLTKAKSIVTDLTAMTDKCKDLESKKTAPKGSMPEFFKSAAKMSDDAKAMTKKIEELINDASTVDLDK